MLVRILNLTELQFSRFSAAQLVTIVSLLCRVSSRRKHLIQNGSVETARMSRPVLAVYVCHCICRGPQSGLTRVKSARIGGNWTQKTLPDDSGGAVGETWAAAR